MKIIKKGDLDKLWIGKIVKCVFCDTIFKLEKKDKTKIRTMENQETKEVLYLTSCPLCKKFVIILVDSSEATTT